VSGGHRRRFETPMALWGAAVRVALARAGAGDGLRWRAAGPSRWASCYLLATLPGGACGARGELGLVKLRWADHPPGTGSLVDHPLVGDVRFPEGRVAPSLGAYLRAAPAPERVAAWLAPGVAAVAAEWTRRPHLEPHELAAEARRHLSRRRLRWHVRLAPPAG
jgi:hypothetical protein